MATKNSTDDRPVATGRRGRPPRRDDTYKTPATPHDKPAAKPTSKETHRDGAHEKLTPHELYRLEKARRKGTPRVVEGDPLEAARREYKALLEADAARGKGGRPRKNAAKPAAAEAEEVEPDELEEAPDEVTDAAEEEEEGEDEA